MIIGICVLIIAVLVVAIVLMLNNANNQKKELEVKIAELEKEVTEKDEKVNELENKLAMIADILKKDISEDTNETNYNNNETEYTDITKELNEDKAERLFVTNVIKNDNNTYTLQGEIFTNYTLTKEEVDAIVKKGSFIIEGKEYIAKEYNGYETEDGKKVVVFYKDMQSQNDNSYTYYIIRDQASNYTLEIASQYWKCWKNTHEKKQITIDKNIMCTLNLMENEEKTAEEMFDNYPNFVNPENYAKEHDGAPAWTETYQFDFENGKCVKMHKFWVDLS